ncbi:DUF5703 domain-containing protein [Tamlana sp. 2201CG12-4]|uniref:DUF5703 domain-containing protein n=1 Tax=Tamlana sp. 2201CG12-4 TaxID=3112582 RepID=UPI002DB7A9A0|nr:DUF5703 domain-containing protein [Tamlana sp. 2201CG12-4]MEC3907854.1 DUF5703 domain-containing protein [Tamlana sp. 2201CG12-4]
MIIRHLLFCFILINCAKKHDLATNTSVTDKYNIIWDSPSKDHNGSMPIGNGDIGLNVWVEQNGDICFYIGKTDTWGDNGRLLKVGKVRVKTEPSLIFSDAEFKQELDLDTGTLLINSKGTVKGQIIDINLELWVDANNPIVHLNYNSSVPVKMNANVELWRTEAFELKDAAFSDLMQSHTDIFKMKETVIVEPDVIEKRPDNTLVWYHHNKKSHGFHEVNKLQGINEFYNSDPILHRTFGALLSGANLVNTKGNSIETSKNNKGQLAVTVLTKHPSQPDEWIKEIETLAKKIGENPLSKRRKLHEQWWKEFWNRSWINASTNQVDSINNNNNDDDAFIVSRAYTLQRFIDACGGRGAFPIKFNGSIFTVPPPDAIPSGDADYRRWGPGYWWQNTRLPYLSMCTTGDYELLQPLFKMYGEDIFKIMKQKTKKNFGFEGAYFPECMYFWGGQFAFDYGPLPWEEREDKLQDSRYHKWEWVSGPELVFMMLDYYDHTLDTEFLQQKIIPLANQIILFFDNYYKTNENRKLVMYPSQAAETWWDTTNPMPELAALYSITERLSLLPENLTSATDKKFWKAIKSKLPEIPLRETPTGMALAPAERFEQKRNIENPELYAVFPFRLFGVGNPNIEYGKNALQHRWDKGASGWRQDDIFMTYLGLTEQAKANLVERSSNYDKNSRFPAFWGPNYDWTPDQDHGGILMKAFQSMLMQIDPYSKKIYLLPAWPKEWNADFKLHAPYNTIIEAKVVNGKIEKLQVTPSSRKEDIIIISNQ